MPNARGRGSGKPTRLRSRTLPFKPRARLLRLLGEELIRDANIAVFELVKNGYDADASRVAVTMREVTDRSLGEIVIEDDGVGMDWETVTGVWLEPGTDFRAKQRERLQRTATHRRLPLGEKGVGRFAVDKLGHLVTLITRAEGQSEVVVEINWDAFDETDYLEDAVVSVKERRPETFSEGATGTRIEIRELRQSWTRGMVRGVHRAVTSICSPFEGPDDFEATLELIPDAGWLDDLLDIRTAMDSSLFDVTGVISQNRVRYEYRFRPPKTMDRVKGRVASEDLDLGTTATDGQDDDVPIDLADAGIGDISFEFYMFDLDPQVLEHGTADKRGLRDFLRANGGVRVYRDGIRVYDYGEVGNDWLDLGGRRVNVPTQRLSNNLVIGAVQLDGASSGALIEKTNREGFIENEAFAIFKDAASAALTHATAERNKDKLRIRDAYRKTKQREPVIDAVADLRVSLEQHGILEELSPEVDAIERDFVDMRDRLLTAAGAGLSLAVVIHEVEKGIRELNSAVERDTSLDRVRQLATHLDELIDGLTYLTRRSGQSNEKGSTLARQALFNTEYRMRHHGIQVTNGFEESDEDFNAKCTRRLVIATLMNLFDNSIYWLNVKHPRTKRIYIGPSPDIGPKTIVVADNGPGFVDPPHFLIEPFMSRKKDGMGLGLHLANEVMKAQGGRLVFPQRGDAELPRGFPGAVVALAFD